VKDLNGVRIVTSLTPRGLKGRRFWNVTITDAAGGVFTSDLVGRVLAKRALEGDEAAH
jgi:hypothetical protein